MGSATRCCRCSLTAIEERAQKEGMVVTTLMEPLANPHYGEPDPDTGYRKKIPGFPRGEVALVHPSEVSPDEAEKQYRATKKENRARGESGVFFAAWFGEITRHCEC